MKFQDNISNMNTYVRTYIHTDKPKPICPPPHFFKVGGIIKLLKHRSCIRKNMAHRVVQFDGSRIRYITVNS